VLLIGLRGLGAEIAKNIVLAGIKSLSTRASSSTSYTAIKFSSKTITDKRKSAGILPEALVTINSISHETS
jgi:molybdopterin/thiamine biosynthesis adenylyltransferase